MFCEAPFLSLIGIMGMSLLMHVSVKSSYIVIGKFLLYEIEFCFSEDLKIILDVFKPSML